MYNAQSRKAKAGSTVAAQAATAASDDEEPHGKEALDDEALGDKTHDEKALED